MFDAKFLVYATQTVLWILFMTIDAYLLIPTILFRYWQRVKANCDSNSNTNQQPRQRRGSSARLRTPKTVVIVGGNFAGLAALRDLQNNPLVHVILIDQRDYFEYTPGILRLFCHPNKIHKLAYPLPQGSHTILQGTVTKTWQNHITYLEAGSKQSKTIPFDYLIMATGSKYSYPVTAAQSETTLASRVRGWQESSQQVQQAKTILILGGGAVGTELAAELAESFTGESRKRITVVDAAPKLVPLFDSKISQYAEQWLKQRNVAVLLGQKLDAWDNKSCTLHNGQKLYADLVFVCFGGKPNSSPLVHDMTTKTKGKKVEAIAKFNSITKNKKQSATPIPAPPAKMDQRQCVQTDVFLRVEGRRNVFCCGDVASPPTDGVKQAYHAEMQGHIAAANILRLETGKPFLRYPEDAAMGSHAMPMMYVLSLGKWDGAIGFNGLVIPGPLAAVLKWIIEWTKVRQMLGRPIGILIWMIADPAAAWISKHLLPPKRNKLV